MNDYYKMLADWKTAVQALQELKETELVLRKQLFAGAFPTPTEGTQRVTLTDGTILKGVFKLNRKVDVEVLKNLELSQRVKDLVVKYKPELDTKMYRTMTAEDREIFDECLTITPGTPALEIEDPAAKKKK